MVIVVLLWQDISRGFVRPLPQLADDVGNLIANDTLSSVPPISRMSDIVCLNLALHAH